MVPGSGCPIVSLDTSSCNELSNTEEINKIKYLPEAPHLHKQLPCMYSKYQLCLHPELWVTEGNQDLQVGKDGESLIADCHLG
jgi:hypothetical protein